jgi:hypothetical protein
MGMKPDTTDILDRAVVETLETRQMLSSVSFEAGHLSISGLSNSKNAVQVKVSGDRVMTVLNGDRSSRQIAGLRSITIVGGDKNDYIEVDDKIKVPVNIYAKAGDDRIVGGGGTDRIEGGAGNDTIHGCGGADRLYGNDGDDRIYGGDGNDTLDGGPGNDKMWGDRGNDFFYAVERYDRITGGEGRDDMGLAKNNQPAKPASTASVPRVTSFSLMNASNGSKVTGYNTLDTGNVLDLAKLPSKLNIAANVDGNASVRFDWDGTKMYRIEHNAPFALGGDNGGTFRAMNLTVGTHTLVGHAIDKDSGAVLSTFGVTFNVINSAAGNSTNKPDKPASTDGNSQPAPTPEPEPTPEPTPTPTKPDNNGGSTSPIIDNNTNASAPSAAITAISTSVPAGHAIHVDALASKLGTGDWHESQITWDFGDSGARYNKLKGFNAAHVYDKAGSYKITLTITNKAGKVDKAQLNVNITAANRKVIYVAANGSDSNTGLSTSSPIKSVSRAAQLADSNTEILFRRGDTFNLSSTVWLNGTNIVIGAYGIGDRPTLMWNGARDDSSLFKTSKNATNVTVQDLSLDTIFNKDTNDKGTPLGFQPDGTGITVRRMELLNLQFGANLNQRPEGFLFQDNEAPLVTGLRKYMVWSEGENIVIIGNKAANSTREHIVRVNYTHKILVMDNDFANISRRTSGEDQYDIRKTALNVQSGSFAYLADNKLDSQLSIGPLGKADGLRHPEFRFHYAILEGNDVKNEMIQVNHGGEHITIRNNVVRANGFTAINVDGYNSTYGRGNIDLIIHNNTAINNDAAGRMISVNSNVDGIRILDNLYYAPNMTIGAGGAAGMRIVPSDLSFVTEIDGNLWSIGGKTSNWVGEDAKNYVGSGYTSSGFQTATEWNNLKAVGTDYFNVITLNGQTFTTQNGQIIGAKRAA